MNGQEPVRPVYRHTQKGYITSIGLGIAAVGQVAAMLKLLRAHKLRAWLYLPGVAATAASACVFSALTVEIDGQSLTASFRGGVVRRTVDLAQVKNVVQLRTPWYWGWGVRLTPKGWLYNVQGRDAVLLELQSGRGVLIGTDEPVRLAAAVEALRPE
jgi:hypothetical protein